MLGRKECLAAAVSAVLAGLAVVILPGPGDGDTIEVRVQGRAPSAPELTGVRNVADQAQLPSSSTSTTAPAAVRFGRVAWARQGDVWLYDAETGKRRALTSDGERRYDSQPRFRDPSRVTYLNAAGKFSPDPTLMEYDLTTGRGHAVTRLFRQVRAYDWRPDGTTLAYYGVNGEGEATELHLTGNGPPRTRLFAPILGRGGYVNYGETRVEWAPDGRHLLVQDTALDTAQDETLYILQPDGTDALPPRPGTWARWSPDGRTIYCLCGTVAKAADWAWQAVDVSTGAATPLLITAGARPSLSPDGRLLAFDDGEDTPSIHVLDLQKPTSTPRFLARAAMAPVWLSSSRLAVTNTRPCPATQDDCLAGGHGSMFGPPGTASALDLITGRRSPLPPISTDGAEAKPSG